MLISIHLNSNRPNNIKDFVKNIENTVINPSSIEVIFNIDTEDYQSKKILDTLQKSTKINLKYISTNIIKTYKDLWKPLNEILKLTDKNAFFIMNLSDEVRFVNKGWDKQISKYIHYYDDDIFRIRLSNYRYYNYTDPWECVFAPDSLAIYTKKWMDIVGMWCPCLGPDSWQQLVSYYLITALPFNHIQYNRDIIDPFLFFTGEGAEFGLGEEKKKRRIKDNYDLWFITVSHKIQEMAKHAASKLQAEILIYNLSKKSHNSNFKSNIKPMIFKSIQTDKLTYSNNSYRKKIYIFEENNVIYSISYKLNYWQISLTNLYRKINYPYYGGGGLINNETSQKTIFLLFLRIIIKVIPKKMISWAIQNKLLKAFIIWVMKKFLLDHTIDKIFKKNS